MASEPSARLLVVHHTPSPAVHELLEAAVAGARDSEANPDGAVDVVLRPALTATAVDALEASAYLLLTPANIGYISGALKHFFDAIYYPVLDATVGRPYGAVVHGNLDSTGAVRAIETITTGLKWKPVAPPLVVSGPPSKEDRQAVYELAGTLVAGLSAG